MSTKTASRALKLALVPVAAIGMAGLLPGVALAAPAQSSGTTSYQAQLQPLNHSGASGTVMMTVSGTRRR